ncbi:hypothetical protein CC86DRAFT_410864 [Ophiobolus disseminans]|uniref:F-box domain-containing protein n=1 Tax=Ophiobolus disseminans TaxID=1469910 RepID=A0A6A6ZL06_9PLEO|nr:hypothetical protein CC86DRAFT_410864 [Ophiobolus disseminans]
MKISAPLRTQFARIIDTVDIPAARKRKWRSALSDGRNAQASCGLLLALVPRLEILSLTTIAYHTSTALTDLFGTSPRADLLSVLESLWDFPQIKLLPSLAGLKHLRLMGFTPLVGACHLSNLETVEICCLSEVPTVYPFFFAATQAFPQVSTLRVGCCYFQPDRIPGRWIEALNSVIGCFPNIKHLSLADPARSSFVYPHTPPWSNPYQVLKLYLSQVVSVLQSKCPVLVSLELADRPWLGDGKGVTMRGFGMMEKLIIPVVVFQMLIGKDGHAGRFPPSLRFFKVTDTLASGVVVGNNVKPGCKELPRLETFVVE